MQKIMEENQWMDSIFDSATKRQAAEPSPLLRDKIQAAIFRKQHAAPTVVWLAAASFTALLFINFTVLSAVKSTDKSAEPQPFNESLLPNNQLY
ncbi:hypothetical protein [Flavobacterium aurantiibacter]|uniref:Uncharacterized protein n=1 Tax=Flavobacterium aurantiibacter TaxID=2023067 RepID=A0A255ZW34_9FLAO|nr:hypothetical protein [Flavobacterium aurantiibacter]OYQ45115.1 hypothetical protein CHX27_06710 [Flavobacterium aurantiibacter]